MKLKEKFKHIENIEDYIFIGQIGHYEIIREPFYDGLFTIKKFVVERQVFLTLDSEIDMFDRIQTIQYCEGG